ncbi:hypothetical protein ACFPM0_02830 [Pseudonocardia sulfidoxydans]
MSGNSRYSDYCRSQVSVGQAVRRRRAGPSPRSAGTNTAPGPVFAGAADG